MVRVRADFSEAAEKGQFSPTPVDAGEYLFKITEIEAGDSKEGNPQLVVRLESPQIPRASYPYYCPLDGKGAWKLRALLEACGVQAGGKKAVAFDTDKLVGKMVGGELEDDEYQGRMKSKVRSVFHQSELDSDSAPAPKKAAAKKAPAPVEEEYEDEDELEEEKPAPKKRTARSRKPAPVEEDDDDLDLDDI